MSNVKSLSLTHYQETVTKMWEIHNTHYKEHGDKIKNLLLIDGAPVAEIYGKRSLGFAGKMTLVII